MTSKSKNNITEREVKKIIQQLENGSFLIAHEKYKKNVDNILKEIKNCKDCGK